MATTDNFWSRVATDGGELVVAGDEGEVLETDIDETNAETED